MGIVSRSNLIQALASSRAPASGAGGEADCKIRHELQDRLGQEDWTDFGERNVIVSGGIVHLWGLVGSPEEHKALLALAGGAQGAFGARRRRTGRGERRRRDDPGLLRTVGDDATRPPALALR